MLNTTVSLARAGIPVELITEYGMDDIGNIIHEFLIENNVGTDYVSRFSNGNTAVAMAFLNDKQDAAYSFYKLYPVERQGPRFPEPEKDDIVLFGSSYSISDPVHNDILLWVKKARNNKALVMYDPNFRKHHLPEVDKLKPRILSNISLSDIIRGSDEDFLNIFGTTEPDVILNYLYEYGCRNLIMTRNKSTVSAWFGDISESAVVAEVHPLISTIGAGDAFNAGIIYSCVRDGIFASGLGDIKPAEVERIMRTGIMFSAEVCKSLDNYITVDFGNRLKG